MLQLLLLSFETDEELDDKALELTRSFESVHLHANISELTILNNWLIDHDIEPLMLQELFDVWPICWILGQTFGDEVFSKCSILPIAVQ